MMTPDFEIAKEVLRVRMSQLLVNEEYKKGAFVIPIHLALGHEAVAVAISRCMRDADALVLSHRNIHYNLARLGRLGPILAEYRLKAEGVGAGAMGSMNLANPGRGIAYTSSILGNNLGVAAGLAFAHRLRGTGGVVFVETGDGAMEEGAFYEALEFAASRRLAMVALVENNEWSLATHISERRCDISLERLCGAFAITHIALEGNDVYRYIEALAGARDSAAAGGPVCVDVRIHTLGGWIKKTSDCPQGRYVNYHAGPAANISADDWPLIESSDADPVFVLVRRFGEARLREAALELAAELAAEAG